MKIRFCGAAKEVTGSCHMITLDDGFKLLLDCGMFQGENNDELNRQWFFKANEIDAVVLSHAHIDHCGRIPKLAKDGFEGNIFCTPATRDLAAIMLMDSARNQMLCTKIKSSRRTKTIVANWYNRCIPSRMQAGSCVSL